MKNYPKPQFKATILYKNGKTKELEAQHLMLDWYEYELVEIGLTKKVRSAESKCMVTKIITLPFDEIKEIKIENHK